MKVTNLEPISLIKDYIQKKKLENIVVVSPDLGGIRRTDKLAKSLDCDKAIVYKYRKAHNEATAENLFGNVSGKDPAQAQL